MLLKKVTDQLIEQPWLDAAAEPVQRTIVSAYNAGGSVGRQVRDFLHGTWLGHPLHPILVAIPIGAWSVSAVLDALALLTGREDRGAAADAALAIGLVGALAAAPTGATDWQHAYGKARPTGLLHATLNWTAIGLNGASWLLRRRGNRGAGRTLSFLAYGGLLVAGYLGGELSYQQQMGVDHTGDETAPEDWVAVLPESELLPDTPTRVETESMPVLLVRRAGQVYAMAETCSHQGGPLSEGELTEDDGIRCPWHGSCFALEDGRVLEGPAVFPQPYLDTRVRAGQIEVRGAQG